jgi:hypothetical protein
LPTIILEKKVLEWLLAGPAWLRFAVELQLLDRKPDVAPVLRDDAIRNINARLKSITAGIPALKSGRVHYTETGKAYWDLFFLADVGLSIADLGLKTEAEEIFRFQSPDGSFTIPPNVRDNYFCMSAILLSSLAKMGYSDDPRILKYARLAMNSRCNNSGWHCYEDSPSAIDACPMDNLNILMLLGQYGQYRESPLLKAPIDLLLEHWRSHANLHGFGVGRRFMSLQYPAVKYGILRVLDCLSLFPYSVGRPDFQNMLDYAHNKAVDGRYFAEAADPAYAGLDFAQDREPSRWITFLVSRINKRVGWGDCSLSTVNQ